MTKPDLHFLTKRQKEIYEARQSGLTYSKIAQSLGISTNGARQTYILAERRVREYEQYIDEKEKNLTPLCIDVNLGELKCIIASVEERKNNLHIKARGGWVVAAEEKLTYEYYILQNLYDRLVDTLEKNKK